ncbi:MAG: hypothetical protein ACKOWF_12315 [Chloroflexota bacterium]
MFAQALCCETAGRADPGTPCGACRSCRKITRGTHPDEPREPAAATPAPLPVLVGDLSRQVPHRQREHPARMDQHVRHDLLAGRHEVHQRVLLPERLQRRIERLVVPGRPVPLGDLLHPHVKDRRPGQQRQVGDQHPGRVARPRTDRQPERESQQRHASDGRQGGRPLAPLHVPNIADDAHQNPAPLVWPRGTPDSPI